MDLWSRGAPDHQAREEGNDKIPSTTFRSPIIGHVLPQPDTVDNKFFDRPPGVVESDPGRYFDCERQLPEQQRFHMLSLPKMVHTDKKNVNC